MPIFKTLSLSLLLAAALYSPAAYAQVNPQTTKITETPPKSIVIKHPAANDPATFFATSNTFMFEVYKPGNMAKIIAEISKDPNVDVCKEGAVTGDYHQVSLVVKAMKDKMWYAALFKKAGLTMIKVNNNPVVEVDKM